MAADPTPWTCPNCRLTTSTPFCAGCGERPLQPMDLTLPGVLKRLLHAVTSIDGRLLHSLVQLLRFPGA